MQTGQPIVCWLSGWYFLAEWIYDSSLRKSFKYGMRCIVTYCLPSRETTRKDTLNVAKVQYKLRVAFDLNLPWYGILKKILVWNGIWNGRFLVWNGNGMEENCQNEILKNRLPFHSIPCPGHAYSTGLIEHIRRTIESWRNSHADRTNWIFENKWLVKKKRQNFHFPVN